MIKRETEISGYPKSDLAASLVRLTGADAAGRFCFYDIETTGLSGNQAFVYLIGVVYFEESTSRWLLVQWLAEEESEEPLLLGTFLGFSASFDSFIQYNGNRFDLPFLRIRYERQRTAFQISHHKELNGMQDNESHEIERFSKAQLDLYDSLKPCKDLFQLSHMRQKDLEKFLGIPDRIYPDGKKCIALYLTWQQSQSPALEETASSSGLSGGASGRSPALEEAIFGHNQEDLCGLGRILELSGYLCLWKGEYEPIHAEITDDSHVRFRLQMHYRLPAKCSGEEDAFSFSIDGDQAEFQIEMKDCKLRQYYANYQDYVYLPAEDTALPKALGQFLDKSLKRPSRPETCYTWFPVTESFLRDSKMQQQYLQHVLPFYLSHLI